MLFVGVYFWTGADGIDRYTYTFECLNCRTESKLISSGAALSTMKMEACS